jgi:preprotein translocase subunit SecY
MFLMWLGEQITERGIGNGISILIIFAGIVAGLPTAIAIRWSSQAPVSCSSCSIILVLAIVVVVTAFVVFMERGQRRITVNYARRMGGRRSRLPEPELAFAAQAQHVGRDPADLRLEPDPVPGHGRDLVRHQRDRWLQTLTAAMLGPEQPLHMVHCTQV